MLKKFLIVFFVSMVPLIELRGAVPIGLSEAFGEALPIIPLYITCILGNMIPVPLIFFFARKILVWGSDKKFIGKFFKFCLEKGEKGGKKQVKVYMSLYSYLLVFLYLEQVLGLEL